MTCRYGTLHTEDHTNDDLFVDTLQHWPPHGGVPKFGFAPSNNPNLEFQEFNSSCYDLRFDIDVIATPDGEGTFLKKAMATK